MGNMFRSASLFNQNLCQWRLSPFPYSNAGSIFTGSGCTNKATPSGGVNWCAMTTC
jgi:hypothetical protein